MTAQPIPPGPGGLHRVSADAVMARPAVQGALLPVAVVALGGNALQHRGEAPDATTQRTRVAEAARAIAPLSRTHRLVICHGNGPQVGLLALESESDTSLVHPYPLDLLGAETQGLIGHMLALELVNAGVDGAVACVVTTTLVDAKDQAFERPSKPIGRTYDKQTARDLAANHGWSVAPDGNVWRRVVASPTPVGICELDAVTTLLRSGCLVICGGGGGVPVIEEGGRRRGVEAVVDKDLTAATLAIALGADRLLILTDVDGVRQDFGTARARTLSSLTVDEAAALDLPAGSMGPKVEAARHFVTSSGRPAAIGALTAAPAVIAGTSGTTILPASDQTW